MNTQPKWWTEEKHGTSWDRAKEAMKRDWEQTKKDFGAGGRELDQDVDDTVKQAVGKDVIPPRNQVNAPGGIPMPKPAAPRMEGYAWHDVEQPIRYGYGARQQYGSQHSDWNDKLEVALKEEWEQLKKDSNKAWNDVKHFVRHGYDRARS